MRWALLLLFSLPFAMALAKSAGHHAHVHGHADLNVAFDSDHKGIAQLSVPAESLYGFEHEPTTVAETKAKAEALAKLETEINRALIFDSSLHCVAQKTKLKVESEKDEPGHQEIHAEFEINCAKSISGTQLSFGFTHVFPKLKSVKGALLTPSGQQAIDVTDDHGSYQL